MVMYNETAEGTAEAGTAVATNNPSVRAAADGRTHATLRCALRPLND